MEQGRSPYQFEAGDCEHGWVYCITSIYEECVYATRIIPQPTYVLPDNPNSLLNPAAYWVLVDPFEMFVREVRMEAGVG